MPKLPVPRAKVTAHGVDGDWQRNRKYHGGPNRAVCIYSEELYAWLREKGIDLKNGSVGENFTTSGIDLSRLAQGNRLAVGDHCDVDLPELIVGSSGWVAKVIRDGVVKPGDSITKIEKE